MSYSNIRKAYVDNCVHVKKIIEKYNKNSFLHNYFDDVVVITLPHRKQQMQQIMNNLNIYPYFFDAILKDTLTEQKLLDENFIKKGSDLNKGRIACHYSHIEVLKRFLQSDHKTCFIFEDDIANNNNITKLKNDMEYIYNQINNNNQLIGWDIINFGRCFDNCETQQYIVNKKDNFPGIVKSEFPKCRHAYAVSRKGAENIIKYSLPLDNIPGDRNITLEGQKGNINIFSTTPPLFFQNRKDFGTTLGNYAKHVDECSPNSELYKTNLSIKNIKNIINKR